MSKEIQSWILGSVLLAENRNTLFRCQRIIRCKHTVVLQAVLSRSRFNHCQNKRLAFPNSAGFLPATLASVISLSLSKTGAVDVSASFIAILELGILSSLASFSCSCTEAYPSGPPL